MAAPSENNEHPSKKAKTQTLEAIRYCNGELEILDQLLLPLESKYIKVLNTEDGWQVIKKMQVRGAPAIAIVGCLSLAADLHQTKFNSKEDLNAFVKQKLEYLVTARPTAVNMADATRKLSGMSDALCADSGSTVKQMQEKIMSVMEAMLVEDVAANKNIGRHGGSHIIEHCKGSPVRILTHCNTGSLATAGYGTALGVVRNVHELGKLDHIYCTETRPYNQGARLTAYELVYDGMPATLVCDSMCSMLMKDKGISAVVVGADRIVANGDTANKIGTYQLAVVAKYHGVPFYVAAPTTSIDMTRKCGSAIVIEERPHQEMTSIKGLQIAAPGIGCWNPAFDVTPAELITGGIVTEFGVVSPSQLESKMMEWLGAN